MHTVTFSTGPVPGPSPSPLFASISASVAPVSPRECALRDTATGSTQILPNAVVETLDLCREFRSLDEHAHRLAQLQPQLQLQALRQGLGTLAQRGLFISAADYLASLARAPAADPVPLRAVVIRACDRPAELRRLLQSLADNARRFPATRHTIVLDDSRLPSNAAEHAALLAAFARETGVPATHVGANATAAIAERLAKARPEARETLAFLLAGTGSDEVGFGGGKGYNLAALLGAGARYALLDDDFLLPLKHLPDSRPGLHLVPPGEMPAWFHPDADAALASGQALAVDPFEHAAAACGATLGRLLAQDEYRIAPEALYGFAPSHAPHLRADTRIASVTHGHRGHSGAPSGGWMLLLEGASRDAFWQDEGGYRRNLEGQGIWYGSRQARLHAHSTFTPFAIDATTLVAPTMPGGRSEDLLFGAVTAALYPHSAALHTRHTIGHLQESGRARGGGFARPVTPACNQFLAELVNGQAGDLRAAAPAQRCLAIAAMLRDAAEAGAASRVALIGDYLRFVRADMAQRLEGARAGAGGSAPDYWRRDIDTAIKAQRDALLADSLPRFSDWGTVDTEAGAATRLQAGLRHYARTLEHWPALFDAAASLPHLADGNH